MDRIFLEDEKVALRFLEIDDLSGDYINWFDSEVVCNGNNHHRFPYTKDQMEKYILDSHNRNSLILAIVDKMRNKHVGNIALAPIDYINSNAVFSIIIGDKDSWGKAIGYSAGKLIVEHAFNQLNIHRISLGTYDHNIGMQKLAEKLNFEKEGIRREAAFKNGRYVDVIEYGLIRKK